MKVATHICLFLIFNSMVIKSAHAQEMKDPKHNTYAVVIGISQYQNSSIPRLTYADKDATLFAEWLQSKAGGNVPGYHVKLFTNQVATIANVYAALDWLKTQARENDIVYFYFSGHGDIETRDTNSLGYLLAWNSPATNYRNNAISVADINESANSLTTVNKAKVIIITDACHSGKMAGDFYKGRQLTATNLQLVLNNQVRLASCEAGELAAEGPGWGGGRGVFSYYLLLGLQGLATPDNKGIIPLNSLDAFMNASFKTDKGLALEKHKQNPVMEGSPLFPIAMVDTSTLAQLKNAKNGEAKSRISLSGLQSLKTLGGQPIDNFFTTARTAELDTVLHFESYNAIAIEEIPLKIVSDYLQFLQRLKKQYDSLQVLDSVTRYAINSIYKKKDSNDNAKWKQDSLKKDSLIHYLEEIIYHKSILAEKTGNGKIDTLEALQKQLRSNKYIVTRFNEKLVQLVHEKTQEMINAYLTGDIAELEKRQYYYAGSRQYRKFLSVLDVAIRIAPETNYLNAILKINRSYLTGLVDRLEMATHAKTDSLLKAAFFHQRQALLQEPYAAYIHNELGNLYLHRHQYDSAGYHFNYANILSPTWAVPWSNKIRLNLALKNIEQAKEAIRIADSLQPNLAYVNVNAGLVMEKDSNYIAAEGYYLNAIAQNNVHYLPFERLGLIYISIGKYALADSFLMEAKNRKDAFTVNDLSFTFGVVLGGSPGGQGSEKISFDCNDVEGKAKEWQPLTDLANSFIALEKNNDQNKKDEKFLLKTIVETPGLSLPHHYLGRKYFSDKNWVMAEKYLMESIRRYIPAKDLKLSFSNQMEELLKKGKHSTQRKKGKKTNADNNKLNEFDSVSLKRYGTCLLELLMYYNYKVVEDHYMLGKIYEEQGRINEALNQYKIIADKENQQQWEQAIYKGYVKPENWVEFEAKEGMGHMEMLDMYETPVRKGGTIKAAKLLENQAKYVEAEIILLEQVKRNREAGYARQAEMDKKNFGPAGRSPFNFFWLKINYDLEAETYNFYNRMLALFPRDSEWYRKAGIFLYERLKLTYTRIPISEQKVFYEFSKGHSYPFEGGESGPVEGIDETGKYFAEVNKFILPGTKEEINILMKAYDPLQTSLTYLQQAIKFSGELAPDPILIEALANLTKWMGHADASIKYYNNLVSTQPGNNTLRNELIELLEFYKRLPAAIVQLDSLHKRGSLSHEQTLKLAYYKMMSKQEKVSRAMLDEFIPTDTKEKNIETAIYVQGLMMNGLLKDALRYTRDYLQTIETSEEEDQGGTNKQVILFDDPFYTEARLLAMANQDAKALEIVKTLLDSGYAYHHVFINDPALARLRKNKKWKKLLDRYPVVETADKINEPHTTINYNALKYRIPGAHYDPTLWD